VQQYGESDRIDMGKNRFKFLQRVAGGGSNSGSMTGKAKRDFMAAADTMDKEDFLGQLMEQWYPLIKKDADVDEEVKKARKRINSNWFKNVFDKVGITDEDIKKVILDIQEVKPVEEKNEEPKTGRNEPCPCGSGKKFKKCCGK